MLSRILQAINMQKAIAPKTKKAGIRINNNVPVDNVIHSWGWSLSVWSCLNWRLWLSARQTSTSAHIVPEPTNNNASVVPAIGIISKPSLFSPSRITKLKMLRAIVKRKTPIPAPIKYTDPLIFLRGVEDRGSGHELGATSEMDDLSSMWKY